MRRILGRVFGIIGLITGFFVGYYFIPSLQVLGIELTHIQVIGFVAGTSLAGALIGLVVAPVIVASIVALTSWLERRLSVVPSPDMLSGTMGLIVGLLIAVLLTPTLSVIPLFGRLLPVVFSVILGYLGLVIGVKKREDLASVFMLWPRRKPRGSESLIQPKILDTSVIIDGRIADVCKSGFIEGGVAVPRFILEELRHIADSSDTLKRNRGRRGLDILNRMQQEKDVPVQIVERDFPDVNEVDSKLIHLAKEMESKIITNDFNLNKVARLEGVAVLNINELANSVKPVVLPGEDMEVNIIRDGKEAGQGIGYLDDGTMIVVDGGKKFIGETIGVLVTSVLQTSAGRMIFARLQNERSVSGHGGR